MAKRHCLLIGVDQYPNVPGADLKGCANDVALMGSLLIDRFGFPEECCRVLVNDEATQAGIRGALDEVLQAVERNDIVVCFYAGHGSRIAHPRRPGQFLESIVPSDSGRGDQPNRDICDREIDRWVQRLNESTPYVTLLFDCCHSGSVTRDVFGEATREIPADLRSLEQMFEDGDLPEILRDLPAAVESTAETPAGYVSGRRRAVTVAACRAEE
ncbi:MAG: caspase family protein, partial [Acidobacteria bacterium]|nr:caspase family protein [Acidobacteriota bacterium]